LLLLFLLMLLLNFYKLRKKRKKIGSDLSQDIMEFWMKI
jgi:hypothetical protein